MYIVLELNQDERGAGISRPVHQFKNVDDMSKFVLTYRGDSSKLEIFQAIPLEVTLTIGAK